MPTELLKARSVANKRQRLYALRSQKITTLIIGTEVDLRARQPVSAKEVETFLQRLKDYINLSYDTEPVIAGPAWNKRGLVSWTALHPARRGSMENFIGRSICRPRVNPGMVSLFEFENARPSEIWRKLRQRQSRRAFKRRTTVLLLSEFPIHCASRPYERTKCYNVSVYRWSMLPSFMPNTILGSETVKLCLTRSKTCWPPKNTTICGLDIWATFVRDSTGLPIRLVSRRLRA